MRKLLAIWLFAVMALPLAAPLLAMSADAESGVPVCCRRSGKHHCMMHMAFQAQGKSSVPQFTSPEPRCPFSTPSLEFSHFDFSALAGDEVSLEMTLTFSEGLRQTESKWRIARDRSRQKRGPPNLQQIA